MWDKTAHLILATQLQLAAGRQAKIQDDGSITSYPGEGWWLRVQFINGDKEAVLPATDDLALRVLRRTIAKRFVERAERKREKASIRAPLHRSMSWRIDIRNFRHEITSALRRYVEAKSTSEATERAPDQNREMRTAQQKIAQILHDWLQDPNSDIRGDEDGWPVIDLEKDRSKRLKLSVEFRDQPRSKKWRSRGNAWLRERGKDPKKAKLLGELREALLRHQTIPADLFFAMVDIKISV